MSTATRAGTATPWGRVRGGIVGFGPWRRFGIQLLWAFGVGIVSTLLGAYALRITPASLSERWLSGVADDNTLHYLVATTAVDSPFFVPNSHMGFPNTLTMFFAPQYDPISAVVLTLFGAVFHNGILVLNLYQLLGFLSVGAASSLLFSTLRVRRGIGTFCALVLALAPYHLQRVSFGHAFVANYWAIPVVVVLLLMVAGPKTNPFERWVVSASTVGMRRARRWIPILLLTLAVSLSLSYYYVFAAILMGGILLGSVVRSRAAREGWKPLLWPAVTIAALAVFIVVQLAILSLDFGDRYMRYFAGRTPELSEMQAGRITSLLLPWGSTGFSPLASLSNKYNSQTSVSIFAEPPGTPIVAVIGMVLIVVFLLARLIMGRRPIGPGRIAAVIDDERAGVVTGGFIWGLLFYTVAGLGIVFAYLVSPELRAWVRISILLIALAMVMLALWMNALLTFWPVRWSIVAVLTVVAFVDQIAGARAGINLQPSADTEYRAFIASAEDVLPAGCGVAQLPAKAFPESGPIGAMPDYNEALPYILSTKNTLDWSYGAVKGTHSGDFWAKATTPTKFAAAVKKSGACAVLVDHLAFTKHPNRWKAFVKLVGDAADPLVQSHDGDNRYTLFKVTG